MVLAANVKITLLQTPQHSANKEETENIYQQLFE